MRDLRGLGSCTVGLVCSNLCLDLKSELSVDRRYLQAGKNLEFAIRDWATETGSVVCRDDVQVTGIFRLFCVDRLVLTHYSVNTFHRQHSRTPIRPNRTYRPTTHRLHGKWVQFQSLWDLGAEYVFNHLGKLLANYS